MTDVVVFDLGGVLCRFRPEARLASFAAASGWSTERVEERIWGGGRELATDSGALTEDEVFELASLDGRLDRATVLACWGAGFAIDDEVVAIADRLRTRRALLTNNGPVVAHLLRGALAPLAERCDPVMLSAELGAVKPTRAAFDRAAQRCGVQPGRLLLVDDSIGNVDGARAAGWEAIPFEDAATLTHELDARGVTSG